MRLDLKKYLFLGHHKALESFFKKAQEAALVHFIDTSHLKAVELPLDLQNVSYAIKILRELPTLGQEEPENDSETSRIIREILDLKHKIEKLEEEERMLSLEIARTEIFGQFSLKDVNFIEKKGNRHLQFFFAKKGLIAEEVLPKELVFISSEHGLDYFVSINNEKRQYEKMVEMRIDHELNTLLKRQAEVKVEVKELEAELKKFEKYNTHLHHAQIKMSNDLHLKTAKKYASQRMNGSLFAIEGWVPAHKLDELKSYIEPLEVHVVEIAQEENEVVPTYLENKGESRIGEDLVHIYDTPSNTDKDPSLWVLLSFALFFSMIIGDGGYGLVFLAGALYFRFKNPALKGGGKRLWKLAILLCSSCIVWGLLTNAFFGMQLAPENSLRKASLLNWLVQKKADYHFRLKDDIYTGWVKKYPEIAKVDTSQQFLMGAKKVEGSQETYEMINRYSDGISMELALLVGVIHISLSLLRYIRRSPTGAGWIIAIWGSYLYFPVFLNATSLVHYVFGFNREAIAAEGLYMIYIGITMAIVTAVIKDRWFGLLEISNVIQIFADILSYLRLYALAMAGAVISATVNDIASSLFFVAGGVLIIFGHALNMVLAVIGGVIHGLRLNFIEWYHYSFEGGGKLFDPLRKIEVE